jgi:hypothetical protein
MPHLFDYSSLQQKYPELASCSLFQSVSAQDDSGNCVNKLPLRWKTRCAHRDTVFYWSLADDSPSCFKDSGFISEWHLLLLVELNIPMLTGVKSGHSLRQVTPLLRMLLVRLGLSSWLGA